MIEAWHCLPVDRAALSRFLGEVPEGVPRLLLRMRPEWPRRPIEPLALGLSPYLGFTLQVSPEGRVVV